jgi:NitT/TauT family transport system ATP-binding protein
MLRASAEGALPEAQVLSLLMEANEQEQARRIMRTAVEWGRYGEIYEFDFHARRLQLA